MTGWMRNQTANQCDANAVSAPILALAKRLQSIHETASSSCYRMVQNIVHRRDCKKRGEEEKKFRNNKQKRQKKHRLNSKSINES